MSTPARCPEPICARRLIEAEHVDERRLQAVKRKELIA
jgi:hypothetical protein